MIWWKDRIRRGEFLIYRPGRLHNVIPTFAVPAGRLGWAAFCASFTTYRDI
jgi:monoamine oxidase